MFNCDIIHEIGTGYRAIVSYPDWPDVEIDMFPDWKTFVDEVIRITGIRLPARKYFKFSRLSDFETVAGIDASHPRTTCIVSAQDRRNGWKRWEF